MKFTYTHITKDYTEITEYKINKNNKIKIKNMYETLEHWNQYKKEKEAKEEMDKFLNELITKNGITNY